MPNANIDISSTRIYSRSSREGTAESLAATTSELADSLQRIIQLFDNILLEDYVDEHEKLPHVLNRMSKTSHSTSSSAQGEDSTSEVDLRASSNLACDFCGADIFQSFFECHHCGQLDGSHTSPGDGLMLCPGCYVEGRTCACQGAAPALFRPFDVLLQDRKQAAEVLGKADREVPDLDVDAEYVDLNSFLLAWS